MSKAFWNSVKPFFPEKSHIASTFQTLKQQQDNQDQQPAQDERYNYNFANLINLRQVSTIEIARRRTITTQKQDLKRNKLQPGSLCWVKPSTKKRSSTTQPYWPSIVLSNDDLVFKLKSPSTQLGVLCLGIKREQMYGLVADIVPWVDGELKQLWNNGGVTKKMSSGTAKRWLHALWQAEFIEEQGYFPEDTDELTCIHCACGIDPSPDAATNPGYHTCPSCSGVGVRMCDSCHQKQGDTCFQDRQLHSQKDCTHWTILMETLGLSQETDDGTELAVMVEDDEEDEEEEEEGVGAHENDGGGSNAVEEQDSYEYLTTKHLTKNNDTVNPLLSITNDEVEIQALQQYVSDLQSSVGVKVTTSTTSTNGNSGGTALSIKVLMATAVGQYDIELTTSNDGNNQKGVTLGFRATVDSADISTKVLCHGNVSERALFDVLNATTQSNAARMKRLEMRLDLSPSLLLPPPIVPSAEDLKIPMHPYCSGYRSSVPEADAIVVIDGFQIRPDPLRKYIPPPPPPPPPQEDGIEEPKDLISVEEKKSFLNPFCGGSGSSGSSSSSSSSSSSEKDCCSTTIWVDDYQTSSVIDRNVLNAATTASFHTLADEFYTKGRQQNRQRQQRRATREQQNVQNVQRQQQQQVEKERRQREEEGTEQNDGPRKKKRRTNEYWRKMLG
jgi:hypothetical protein